MSRWIMEGLSVYLPRDRLSALASGTGTLPDRTRGAALMADISGFTPLAEALALTLGPLRGPEELTRQLGLVYAAVISEVDCYRGSVIGFSGDAMTCWYDNDDGRRAVASGLAMQAAMQRLGAVVLPNGKTVELTMRVGVAVGPARRFQIGDPSIQVMDVLAGATLERMAAAQQAARKGEVVVDEAGAQALREAVCVAEWRPHAETGQRFAQVSALRTPVQPSPWPTEATGAIEESRLREWLLPPVYARLRARQGEFLTEMRPVVAMFLRFQGIDYDGDDEAGAKLDAYIRWVQRILATYESYLMGVTIGDKGSYLYSAFGAPLAHEKDVWLALTAALALRTPPSSIDFIGPVQIGLSRGTTFAGAYGGATRRSYGILGDDVNLAARLMAYAPPGQVLASGNVRKDAGDGFVWEALPPIGVKGKSEPVAAFALLDTARPRAVLLEEPTYALPMVGRGAELGLIAERLNLALSGRGQIVGITGEAGMGKSRLVAEAIHLAGQRKVAVYGGQCHSYGTNTSYLVWWNIWQGLFNLDARQSPAEQIRAVEAHLAGINPDLAVRLPLLSAVTRLPIPDNEVTRSFDAKLRKASLEALLMECLRAQARRTPLFIVLEDSHWLDPLSRDLLDATARTVADLPVLLLLAYRPPAAGQPERAVVSALPYFKEIRLSAFTRAEAEQLIALKVARLFGVNARAPRPLVDKFVTLAEGNPFYIDELLNYLQDRRLGLEDAQALEQLELPTSLRSLILSRIDELSESQKVTLKVASVVGRVFRAATLWGAYPQLGTPEQVKTDLEALRRLDVTALDVPEPELIYLFKHIVTQEVAYESLPFATRAMLHDRVGGFIERTYGPTLDPHLDLLAYHFDRSDNAPKKREYLLKAGVAAQGRYANSAAVDYFQRVSPLLAEGEQIDVLLKLGQVLELLGQWKDVGGLYQQALGLAGKIGNRLAEARCQTAIGELLRKEACYADAATWLGRAHASFAELGDDTGVARTLHYAGTLAAQQGDHAKARTIYMQSLAIRRRLGDKPRIGSLLSNLAILAHQYTGELGEARKLHEEGLAIRRELGDRWAIANSLNNLGVLLHDQGDLAGARTLLEESVALNRQVGDHWAIANSLSSLASVTLDQKDFATTRKHLEESLAINHELGERRGIAFLLEYFGKLAALQGEPDRALRLIGAASALREAIGAPLSPAEIAQQGQLLDSLCAGLASERRATLTGEGKAMSLEQAIAYAVEGNGVSFAKRMF